MGRIANAQAFVCGQEKEEAGGRGSAINFDGVLELTGWIRGAEVVAWWCLEMEGRRGNSSRLPFSLQQKIFLLASFLTTQQKIDLFICFHTCAHLIFFFLKSVLHVAVYWLLVWVPIQSSFV